MTINECNYKKCSDQRYRRLIFVDFVTSPPPEHEKRVATPKIGVKTPKIRIKCVHFAFPCLLDQELAQAGGKSGTSSLGTFVDFCIC